MAIPLYFQGDIQVELEGVCSSDEKECESSSLLTKNILFMFSTSLKFDNHIVLETFLVLLLAQSYIFGSVFPFL
jgi:hypothetical protein